MLDTTVMVETESVLDSSATNEENKREVMDAVEDFSVKKENLR